MTTIARVFGTAVIVIASAQGGLGLAQEGAPVIEVSAKKYEFNPEKIHVKNGTHVRLRFTATDRDHGVEFDVYPKGSKKKGDPGLAFAVEKPNEKPSFKLVKGEAQTIEFDAKVAGTYEIHCSVFCGMGHHGMDGAIIVDP